MDKRTKIISILQTVCPKAVNPDPSESLFDLGYLDSFALQDMVSALEKEFDIKVSDKDATPRKFETIERIESYLESRGR